VGHDGRIAEAIRLAGSHVACRGAIFPMILWRTGSGEDPAKPERRRVTGAGGVGLCWPDIVIITGPLRPCQATARRSSVRMAGLANAGHNGAGTKWPGPWGSGVRLGCGGFGRWAGRFAPKQEKVPQVFRIGFGAAEAAIAGIAALCEAGRQDVLEGSVRMNSWPANGFLNAGGRGAVPC